MAFNFNEKIIGVGTSVLCVPNRLANLTTKVSTGNHAFILNISIKEL